VVFNASWSLKQDPITTMIKMSRVKAANRWSKTRSLQKEKFNGTCSRIINVIYYHWGCFGGYFT